MARIKSSTGRRYGARDYYISRTQCGAVISPNQDYIWVGDDALDYDTLNPQFSKTCSGLLGFGGDLELPIQTALISNKATAIAPHNSGNSEILSPWHNWIYKNNTSFTHNLDKGSRIDKGGTVFSFEDSGGNPHHLITVSRGDIANNGASYYVLLQGDDFSNPINSIKGTFDNTTVTHNLYLGATYRNYVPIAVDAVNKVIYAYSFALRISYGSTGTYGLCEIPFTTVPVDGTITLGTPSDIVLDYQGNGRHMNSHPVYYAGQDNSGANHFLMFTENDHQYWSTTAAGNRIASSAIKTVKHRVLFYKYDPSTTTVTTIADLKGSEGFVGDVNQTTDVASDHFSFYVPTHFEQSPIVGETDIYYAFSPCFDANNGNMSLLLHTWDKSADTFATEVASFTFNGADVIQDYITYIQHDDINNMSTQLNCVLTKDGSSYYITVFYNHYAPDVVAVNSASTLQTALTFSINSSDFSALTYHSHTAMTALSWASQDINNTKLFIIEPNEATLWTFGQSGWTKTASESGICRGITQDQDARYWAVLQNTGDYDDLANDPNAIIGSSKLANMTLALLSADLPASVSVVFDDATITYAGTNLTKNLTVNAYDENGLRVAKSVKLKITGSNAVFQSNSSTILTTTTSAVADTSVALTISGAGFVNVSASFTI